MKKIQSKRHKELQADHNAYPPVNYEDDSHLIKDKKKKKIYQLNQWVDDVSMEEVVE